MIKNQEIVERNIHGTYFLIDLKQNYFDDKCYIYELNEMGHYIWNNIDLFPSVKAFVSKLQSELTTQVPFETLLKDVSEFIQCLLEEGFLLKEDNNEGNQ